jgi:hypothetical protein
MIVRTFAAKVVSPYRYWFAEEPATLQQHPSRQTLPFAYPPGLELVERFCAEQLKQQETGKKSTTAVSAKPRLSVKLPIATMSGHQL